MEILQDPFNGVIGTHEVQGLMENQAKRRSNMKLKLQLYGGLEGLRICCLLVLRRVSSWKLYRGWAPSWGSYIFLGGPDIVGYQVRYQGHQEEPDM